MKIRKIGINSIVEGYSPRRDFSRKEGLKESIEKEKLLDPLLVRKVGESYLVIDGVMRFGVVQELGWKEVDCIIIDADEEKSYHLAFIKNTERNNLNPIEESLHLKTVQDKFGYNVEDLVRQGYATHRSTLDNKISLLSLPDEIQQKIADGTIKPTTGYHLAKLKDEDLRCKVAEEVLASPEMTTPQVEQKVKSLICSRKREEKETIPQVAIPQGDIPGVYFKDASDMSELPDESVGLIVTSPLYGVGMEYEEDIGFEDLLGILCKVFSECTRVLVPGGKICVNFGDIHNFGTRNGGRPEIKLMGHHYQEILGKLGLRLIETIIWKKCTPGKKDFNWSANPHVNYHQKTKHGSYRILNNTEHIYVFVKDGEREVPFDIEQESKISKDEWKEWVDGVWEIPPVRRQEGHPAQFPEEIPRRLIRMYSYKGDIVLDCFGGGMNTLKVANELGRVGIGYEKEEKYKPVIMEKLGLTEKDLKKPEVDEDRRTKLDDPQFTNKFEEMITQILADNNKTSKDIVSARIPEKSAFSKDDIQIVWKDDDEDPEPSGPAASSQLAKADDYEVQNADPIGTGKNSGVSLKAIKHNPRFINRLVCGDSFKLIKQIEKDSSDLTLTSPPYADIKSYGKNVKIIHPDDYVDWILPLFNEIARILKPTGSFILNINDRIVNKQRHIYVHELIVRAVKETPLKLYGVYHWIKPTTLPNGNSRRLNNVTEYLIHFCKDENQVKWNMDAVRELYDENTVKRCQYLIGGFHLPVDKEGKPMERKRKMIQLNGKGKIPSNVFHFPTACAVRGKKHPAAFHSDLPSWFIKALTDEGDIVVDVFSGSGTTCLAAKQLRRKYIGFELNAEYHKFAEERLENAALVKAA